MKQLIAIPVAEKRVSAHFGHVETFAFVDVDDAHPEARAVRELEPPPHKPGALPRWLKEQGATVVIAGGMGRKAVELLQEAGITTVLGVPPLAIDAAIDGYLQGTLATGLVACNHGDDKKHGDCAHD